MKSEQILLQASSTSLACSVNMSLYTALQRVKQSRGNEMRDIREWRKNYRNLRDCGKDFGFYSEQKGELSLADFKQGVTQSDSQHSFCPSFFLLWVYETICLYSYISRYMQEFPNSWPQCISNLYNPSTVSRMCMS